MSKILVLIAAIVAVGAISFWYWMTTPFFTAQQIATSIQSHDLEKFEQYVDVSKSSESLVKQLLTEPVQNITHLSKLQQSVVDTATRTMAKSMTRALSDSTRKFVAGSKSNIATESSSDEAKRRDESRRKALAGLVDTEKFKDRAITYARVRDRELLSRLIQLSQAPGSKEFAALLKDFGFTREGFRSWSFKESTGGQDGVLRVTYLNPTSDKNIELGLILRRPAKWMPWKVEGFENLAAAFDTSERTYRAQVEDLVKFSISDISIMNLENNVKSSLQRARDSRASHELEHRADSFARDRYNVDTERVKGDLRRLGTKVKNDGRVREGLHRWRKFQSEMDTPR